MAKPDLRGLSLDLLNAVGDLRVGNRTHGVADNDGDQSIHPEGAPLQLGFQHDPLRYYLVVIRATFLKGVGLDVLWPDMLGVAALGAGLLTISILRFRKSLD